MMTYRRTFIRPPDDAREIERYDEKLGAFIQDDGKPGLAFSAKERGFPMAYYYEIERYWEKSDHPNVVAAEKAMSRTVERWRCANGHALPALRKRKVTE